MSILDTRPGLRWLVPAAVGAVVAAGALAAAGGAAADPSLPPMTAEQLLVEIQQPSATALSGIVSTRVDLGLPALPVGSSRSADPTTLATGSHTIRAWVDGPTRQRLALMATSSETDLVRSGDEAWEWSSADRTVEHYLLPALGVTSTGGVATAMPWTPQEAASRVLAALDPTTAVSVSGTASVAGRDAYELQLEPRGADTLVARVSIAVDAETHVPLRVRVQSTSSDDPAVDVGFTSVTFATPDPAVFEFTPPAGSTVTEHDLRMAGAQHRGWPAGVGEPVVVGSGWGRVVIVDLPPDALAQLPPGSSGADAEALAGALAALPQVSGAWGSGRVLAGTLFSAVLTDDGRLAVGAVPVPAVLSALAARA